MSGVRGDAGDAGVRGNTGVRGNAGVRGDTGARGDAGVREDAGVRGDAGVLGTRYKGMPGYEVRGYGVRGMGVCSGGGGALCWQPIGSPQCLQYLFVYTVAMVTYSFVGTFCAIRSCYYICNMPVFCMHLVRPVLHPVRKVCCRGTGYVAGVMDLLPGYWVCCRGTGYVAFNYDVTNTLIITSLAL